MYFSSFFQDKLQLGDEISKRICISAYGCSTLKVDSVRKLFTETRETEAQKRSSPIHGQRALILQIFYASRMNGNKAVIHTAEISREDIIEYLDGEKKCIVLPENVRHRGSIKLYGLDFLQERLPQIDRGLSVFRDLALDYVQLYR